ncbi:esterase, partial [Streptococcus pyogenes]
MKQSYQKWLISLGLIITLSLPVDVVANSRSWKSWFIEQYFWLKRDKSYYSKQDDPSFQRY